MINSPFHHTDFYLGVIHDFPAYAILIRYYFHDYLRHVEGDPTHKHTSDTCHTTSSLYYYAFRIPHTILVLVLIAILNALYSNQMHFVVFLLNRNVYAKVPGINALKLHNLCACFYHSLNCLPLNQTVKICKYFSYTL